MSQTSRFANVLQLIFSNLFIFIFQRYFFNAHHLLVVISLLFFLFRRELDILNIYFTFLPASLLSCNLWKGKIRDSFEPRLYIFAQRNLGSPLACLDPRMTITKGYSMIDAETQTGPVGFPPIQPLVGYVGRSGPRFLSQWHRAR